MHIIAIKKNTVWPNKCTAAFPRHSDYFTILVEERSNKCTFWAIFPCALDCQWLRLWRRKSLTYCHLISQFPRPPRVISRPVKIQGDRRRPEIRLRFEGYQLFGFTNGVILTLISGHGDESCLHKFRATTDMPSIAVRCLVPRPHYSARPIRFGSRGPSVEVRPRQKSSKVRRN